MNKDPRMVFESTSKSIEECINIIREVLSDNAKLSNSEEHKLDKVYELTLSLTYYYEKMAEKDKWNS